MVVVDGGMVVVVVDSDGVLMVLGRYVVVGVCRQEEFVLRRKSGIASGSWDLGLEKIQNFEIMLGVDIASGVKCCWCERI